MFESGEKSLRRRDCIFFDEGQWSISREREDRAGERGKERGDNAFLMRVVEHYDFKRSNRGTSARGMLILVRAYLPRRSRAFRIPFCNARLIVRAEAAT